MFCVVPEHIQLYDSPLFRFVKGDNGFLLLTGQKSLYDAFCLPLAAEESGDEEQASAEPVDVHTCPYAINTPVQGDGKEIAHGNPEGPHAEHGDHHGEFCITGCPEKIGEREGCRPKDGAEKHGGANDIACHFGCFGG